MLKQALVLTSILFFSSAVNSQSNPVCAGFQKAIDESSMEIAQLFADGVTDRSAARDTSRQTRIGNEWLAINVNVTLMAQNKCEPLNRPPNSFQYVNFALECGTALIKGEKNPQSCNRDNWKPKN